MTETLGRSYTPADTEPVVRERWARAGSFHVILNDTGDPYSIVIPPPNVTAALHLGHALNNTLQDILVRVHRMRGCRTLWMPGTDHAGIATQMVVEKRLQRQEKKRTDYSRERFVEMVQEWKDEYETTILGQLKAMGCSCDWERLRFTMDPICGRAVREAFFRLFADGLIYRGKRLVNWDPVSRTALADDEVEMLDVEGHMWYLRYPLEPDDTETAGCDHVVVATTRPETMLGDTAVALNPNDPRAERLLGCRVRLPIVGRTIPIVADDYVVRPDDGDDPKAAFATGFLKVTPAHDPNDWEIGLRHDLAVINILAPDGTISRDHGWPAEEFESGRAVEAEEWLGLSREDARERVVEWFETNGLLESVRDYTHSVGHSYRSHVPIEPYLSDQWYVRVTDDAMRGEALRAMHAEQVEGTAPPRAAGERTGDGELRFHPARYARVFQAWHEKLRDWCISRQLWWGHRIPIWSYDLGSGDDDSAISACDAFEAAGEDRAVTQRGEERLTVCVRGEGDRTIVDRLEAAGYERDPDVLDTWFSSALWPISTMGWPDPDADPATRGLLEVFNPTDVLCTGRDIITLWVSRMVMFNRYFRDGTLPFRDVSIHPMVQDGHGQRMSKSLGNGVDPRDIIASHGADGMRFALTEMATATQDVRMPVYSVCPHCGQSFAPQEVTTPTGHRVSAPTLTCPACKAKMVSSYGVASGLAEASDQQPLARNGSSRFDKGRNFANKLWNATRFALSKLETVKGRPEVALSDLGLADRWMISRLHRSLNRIQDALADYEFSVYAETMYDLVKRDFCDNYVEVIKPTIARHPAQQQVLRTLLDAILRMLHPICPYVTETLWPAVVEMGESGLDGIYLAPGSRGAVLATAAWPAIADHVDDPSAVDLFERLQTLVRLIRAARSEHRVLDRTRITLHAPPSIVELLREGEGVVETLALLERVVPVTGDEVASDAIGIAFEGEQLGLTDLVEAVDADARRRQLQKLQAEKRKAVAGYRGKLANTGYVENAPPHVVQETREKLAEAEADLDAAERAIETLGV